MADVPGLVSLSKDVAQCDGRVDPEAPPSIFFDDVASQVCRVPPHPSLGYLYELALRLCILLQCGC
jgi:hypothetical protein